MLMLTFLLLGGYLLTGYGHPGNGYKNVYPGGNSFSGRGNGNSGNSIGNNNSSYPQLNPSAPILVNISIGQIYGLSSAYNITLPLINGGAIRLIDNKFFDLNKPTICYFHGFGDRPYNIYVQTIAKAILLRDVYNFIFLDWSSITYHPGDVSYYTNFAAPNATQLAPYLAQLFLQWFSKGLCDSTFHLIAHSLGAELAGMVGNYVQIQSNNAHKIRHLTGLDPAQPLFFNPETYRHIRSTDAWFVDIYHTNPYSQGAPYDVGTADIWFNDPSIPQPGCDIPGNTDMQKATCSHVRAIYLYIESILARLIYEFFYCVKASSWADFVAGTVDYSDIIVAGFEIPFEARGPYWCTTSNTSHYTNALRGIGYNPPGA